MNSANIETSKRLKRVLAALKVSIALLSSQRLQISFYVVKVRTLRTVSAELCRTHLPDRDVYPFLVVTFFAAGFLTSSLSASAFGSATLSAWA